MADVLVVDLDGVLRLWDPEEIAQVEAGHSLPPGSIHATAFEPPLLEAAITGRITDAQWRAEVATRLSGQHGVDGSAAVAGWSQSCGRIDPTVLAVIRRERQRRQVVLLSNATTRLHDDLAVLGVTDEFDAVFSTADLGVAKPDGRAFREVCARLGVVPAHCAFVDDSPANVHSAIDLGMRGHVYRTSQELTAFLDDLPSPRR
jgi:putative hydrolase of the HAD superfamily